ncbi:DNA polymerase III subunit gamma/tau [Pelovirga terrestris]|uniref:DNA polymerase III subunit gamma/tau n=1 Tax=Pelovirga terrestris TaxID=2771352 RepID=A0A8J6ULJ8_9BACT|nr:DNA polymerase III subunit gamma/tau [Pelovirga terrestris]MBD1401282.1 DNA polymerase III subunit gamma/tau [Pelovirga terrestris]
MSYLVLARKWRPQLFDDLVGQEHVSQTLKNAITTDRVHHAFLFTGARGVGKTSAARIFAKALNCQQGVTTTPCGTCSSCVEITSGQGIDVLEIDGASHNGVDDIRELRDAVRYLPSQGRYKIIIIDEVHMLSNSAFNALLKTLEEPPAHVKFIFATTEPHKIPVTILSRCQRFDFRKIGIAAVQARLRYIAGEEEITISDIGLAAIARHGGGSMRDALSAFDQVIACCGNEVADEPVQQILGQVSSQLLLDTLAAIVERDPPKLLRLVAQIDDLGHSFRQFCHQLVALVRGLVILKVIAQPGELLDVSEGELAELRRLAEPRPLDEFQRILAFLLKTEAELATSSFSRLTMEVALVKLATLPTGIDVATLIQRLERLEKKLLARVDYSAPAAVAPPVVSEGHGAAPAAVSTSHGADLPPEPPPLPEEPEEKKPDAQPAEEQSAGSWAGLVAFVRNRQRPRISSLLEQASLLTLELPLLRIAMPAKFFGLADSEMQQNLQGLAAEYFSVPVTIEMIKGAHGEAQPPSLHEERERQETDRQRKLRENALEHPLVKSALEIFGGTVEKVTPIDKGFV